jgi:hypothetical protein
MRRPASNHDLRANSRATLGFSKARGRKMAVDRVIATGEDRSINQNGSAGCLACGAWQAVRRWLVRPRKKPKFAERSQMKRYRNALMIMDLNTLARSLDAKNRSQFPRLRKRRRKKIRTSGRFALIPSFEIW